MKLKSLILVVGFIPTLVIAEGAPVIAPSVIAGAPSNGNPGANSGVIKPAAPLAVKPTPAHPKLAAEMIWLQQGAPPVAAQRNGNFYTYFVQSTVIPTAVNQAPALDNPTEAGKAMSSPKSLPQILNQLDSRIGDISNLVEVNERPLLPQK